MPNCCATQAPPLNIFLDNPCVTEETKIKIIYYLEKNKKYKHIISNQWTTAKTIGKFMTLNMFIIYRKEKKKSIFIYRDYKL